MERLINELDQKQNDYDKDLQLIKDKIYKDNISIVNIRELINSKKTIA